jgi:hypothetical protein
VDLGDVGLADLLISGVGEGIALFGDFSPVSGSTTSSRARAAQVALAAVDGVEFVAQVDLRVRAKTLTVSIPAARGG